MTVAARTIDVQAFFNEHPLSRHQLMIFALCFLVMAVDGYDTVVVGYIAPALRAEWTLSPGDLTPLFGAGLIGLAVGSFVLGPLAGARGTPNLARRECFQGVSPSQ